MDPLSAAFAIGKIAIEKLWPDPAKQAAELRKLEELRQVGDLARLNASVSLLTGQLGINLQEAKHKSIFVAGWRPAIGWICGLGLVYQFVLYGILMWLWSIASIWAVPLQCLPPITTVVDTIEVVTTFACVKPPPPLDVELLLTLLMGMLGLGGMRSFDKFKGTSTESIGGRKSG